MYEIYGKGGSIGEINFERKQARKTKFVSGIGKMWLIGTAKTKDEAKGVAKGFKSSYSLNERRYYGVYTRIFKVN